MHDLKIIGSKEVYIVRDHHHALLPWAFIRRRLDQPPLLVTLDHHTDTCLAFRAYMSSRLRADESYDHLLHDLVSEMDFRSDTSMLRTIEKLRNDEHIQAAIRAKILDVAFVVSIEDHGYTQSIEEKEYLKRRFGSAPLGDRLVEEAEDGIVTLELPDILELPDVPEPKPPFTYSLPDNRCFITRTNCLPDCERMPHEDDCLPRLYDSVLDDIFLNGKWAEANAMAKFAQIDNIESHQYILDIDLDYFHTRKAVNPKAKDTFLRLVRNCQAITIALEPDFVSELQMDEDGLSSEYLLERLQTLILEAQS